MDRAKATTERRRETIFLLALCVVLGFPGDACSATSVVIPTPPPRPPGLQSPELGTPEPPPPEPPPPEPPPPDVGLDVGGLEVMTLVSVAVDVVDAT